MPKRGLAPFRAGHAGRPRDATARPTGDFRALCRASRGQMRSRRID